MKIHIKSAEKALKAIYFNQFYSYDLEKSEIKYEDYAVISIRDTSQPSPITITPVGNLKAVLVTSFTDLPPRELIADGITKETYDVRYGGYMKPFTVKEAYEIINFVRTLPHSVKHILVHCSAGISRSCAVGAFLEMWLNKNTWKTTLFSSADTTDNLLFIRRLNAFMTSLFILRINISTRPTEPSTR